MTGTRWALLSQLYLEGLTQETRDALQKDPVFGPVLPHPFDADEAGADHQHLLGFAVHPYASLFLDVSGMVGGSIAHALQRVYQHADYPHAFSSEGADHIGHLLGFIGYCLETGKPLSRNLVHTHLLPWLPALVQAIRQQPAQPFYHTLAQHTLEEVMTFYQALPEATTALLPVQVPEPPALLENTSTGLKDIAHYLTTPCWSGCYLSRDDIARLGRSEHLPRGFGSRAMLLHNLLRSAVAYERAVVLWDHLMAIHANWETFYRDLCHTYPDEKQIWTCWIERLTLTKAMLAQLRKSCIDVT